MVDATLQRLTQSAVDVLPAGELERRLARARETGRPLRVKLGIDPTAPDVTLGHAVVLSKLRDFQDAGHTAVLIVGDYTARVGDPSGRTRTRPVLSAEEIEANAQGLIAQYGRVIDPDRVEIRRNSEWLESLGTAGLLELAARTTVARILERDDFAKRLAAGAAISVQELLYPLLQGYDSVAVRADVEIGGTDQTFNLLMGRELQPQYGQEPQVVLTTPLLVGTDGTEKMSKSLGNYIGVADDAETMYGRAMSIRDEIIGEWMRLASGLDAADADAAVAELEPVEAKRLLARSIVERFHGAGSGDEAQAAFLRVHREHGLPDEVATVPLPEGETAHLPALLVAHLGVTSTSEARRLIAGGGVRLDGEAVTGLDVPTASLAGKVMQRSRRAFVRFAER